MLENLKELVNDEQMINNNSDRDEVTIKLKGLRINAKVIEGEKITKMLDKDIVR